MADIRRMKFVVSQNDYTNQWRAVVDGWEPGEAIGVGDTPGEAVDDLLECIEQLKKPEA